MSWLSIFGNDLVDHIEYLDYSQWAPWFTQHGFWCVVEKMDSLGRGHRAFISACLVPLFSFNLTLLISLFSSLYYGLIFSSLGLKYNKTKTKPNLIFNLLWQCPALPAQGSRRPYHHSLFNRYKLLSTSLLHWNRPLVSSALSWLYLMGSHYVSLPRHFWSVHLCHPLCSLEFCTTTLAGFHPTSLGTPVLAPLKVVSIGQPCIEYLFLEPRHRKALVTQAWWLQSNPKY